MTQEPINQRMILISLFFSFFVVMSPGILSGVLLIDISQAFNTQIGLVAQIRSLSTSLGVIMALVMGAISVRYKHKNLLLIGLGLLAVSAIGCCYAPNLTTLFIVYSLSGIGGAMVSPMTNSLVREHIEEDLRPLAIGMLIASASLAYVIGAPAISQLAQRIGWRYTFLSYILILNLLSILLVQISLPIQNTSQSTGSGFLSGFKTVAKNRSALACLIGATLSSAAWQGIVFFSTSFYRSNFELPTLLAAYLLAIIAVFFTIGSVLSGRITNKIGRKRLTIFGLLVMSSFTILFTNIPNFWVSFPIAILGGFFGGIRYAASNNLSLEQIPEYGGTMMSLNTAAVNLGATLGSMIGGYILLVSSWQYLGAALGSLGLIALLIYQIFTKDPLR